MNGMTCALQGQPRDHNEYVIYDKRLALIEYVVFYSTLPVNSPVNDGMASRGDVTELLHEFVNSDSRVSQNGAGDSDSRSSTTVSGGSSGRSTPADLDNDVLPLTYEPVKSVNVVRQRTKPSESGVYDSHSVNGALCNVYMFV